MTDPIGFSTWFCACCMEKPLPGGYAQLQDHYETKEHLKNEHDFLINHVKETLKDLRKFESDHDLESSFTWMG